MDTQDAYSSDVLLTARLEDLSRACAQRNAPRFTAFLDEHQQAVARMWLEARRHPDCVYAFSGPESGVRRMLGFFPDWMEPDPDSDFPISCLGIRYKKEYTLGHRDVLGALMALRIKREAVGDIVIDAGQANFYLLDSVRQVVQENLSKVGRVGVTLYEPSIEERMIACQKFEEIPLTEASLRLDSLVSSLTRKSRENGAALVREGRVLVNHLSQGKTDTRLKEGDVISISGYGKYILHAVGDENKKGRIRLTVWKYV